MAFDSEKETRLQLLHEIHNIDRMESMELFQKARIKRDIEGDKNTKFFHCLIKQNRRRQAIQGIMVDGMRLSHFFYADDVVLVKEWNQVDMDNIIRLLNVFYLAFGLRININKSNVYGIRVSNNDIKGMARITGCSAGSFPFTYLGLPIGLSMKWLIH
ncbi:hypothetical protein Tco_1567288 [Tanacetum coccineum]